MGIGFFQFDNLVKNRVPFALVVFGADLSALYQGMEIEHLKRYSIIFENEPSLPEIVLRLQGQHYGAQDPVICLTEDGIKAKTWSDGLEDMGFKNCYHVEGGLAALRLG